MVPKYTILIKREGDSNFWHNLMEVFSTAPNLDVLRMSPVQSLLQTHHIIVPLPSGSNSLWQSDWEERDCTNSILLRTFVQRVLVHVGIDPEMPSSHPASPVSVRDRPLRVTVIDRRGTRQILNLASHVTALAAAFPSVNITSVDLAALSLDEQIHLIRDSDLLVGAHGARLTHIMFKKPGEGGVVDFKSEGTDFMGFRNLAKMNGNQYWSTHAEIVPPEEVQGRAEVRDTATSSGVSRTRDPWHFANLEIEAAEFLRTVGDAIRALTVATEMGSTKERMNKPE
ncbi:hypothetical protein N0V82_002841 [Gnomoniopsis sp. IMI 355080]|nr:hypothetical protein N0V82_002841 [Gnomoniopsis sp. IMI 355080]